MSSIPKMQSAIQSFKNPTSHQIKDPYKVAINRYLPLTSAQKRVLLYLLEKYNPFLENNIFPENATIALDLGLTESYVKDIRRELNKGGWIFTISTYKIVNKKMVQISNRYKLPDTILTYGTPDYGPALEAVLKYQAEHVNPSVAMAKGMSAHEAFKTCKGYEILNPSNTWSKPKLVEAPKEEFTQGGGQPGQHLILKTISPGQKNNTIDHNLSIKEKPINRDFNKSINQFFEDIEAKKAARAENRRILVLLNPLLKRFETCCHRTLTILETHWLAGNLRKKVERGEASLEYYLSMFETSLEIIESWPLLQRSHITSLGRLFDPDGLKACVYITQKKITSGSAIADYDEKTVVMLIASIAQESGSDALAVVGDLCGPEPLRKLTLMLEQEEEECPYSSPQIIYTEEPKQRYQYV